MFTGLAPSGSRLWGAWIVHCRPHVAHPDRDKVTGYVCSASVRRGT